MVNNLRWLLSTNYIYLSHFISSRLSCLERFSSEGGTKEINLTILIQRNVYSLGRRAVRAGRAGQVHLLLRLRLDRHAHQQVAQDERKGKTLSWLIGGALIWVCNQSHLVGCKCTFKANT